MGIQISKSHNIVQRQRADIMFCVDNSQSMADCIDAVRETVNIFVDSLEKGVSDYSPVDWQIGFVGYSDKKFRFLDLTKNTSKFKDELRKRVVGNEFTPGAIDFAISNASWREHAHFVVVVFTDEPITGGKGAVNEHGGVSLFDDLLKKIHDSHIQIIYYGVECPYYKKFAKCSKSEVNIVTDFSGINFEKLMERMAQSVTSATYAASTPSRSVVKNLVYDLSHVNIERI